MSKQGEQKRAQQAALWNSSVQGEGGGGKVI